MKKAIAKILSLVLIVSLNWTGLSAVMETFALLENTEISSENSFTAGTLFFSLTNGNQELEAGIEDIRPGDVPIRDISVMKDGSLNFQYTIDAFMTDGNVDFCSALQVEASLEGVVKYTGKLMDLNTMAAIAIGEDGRDDWRFTVTLPETPTFSGESCEFKFIFDGWQENLSLGEGLSDRREVEELFESEIREISAYSPIADSFIDQNSPDSNHGDGGELQIKTKTDKNERAFVRFDFNFPEETEIISSNLKLHLKTAPAAFRTYEARRVLDGWEEMAINWNNQPGANESPTDTVDSGTTNNVWLSWNVISDVRDFISGVSNFGWELRDSAENSGSAREAKFNSRENNEENYRPVLEVSFKAPEAITSYPVVNEIYYNVDAGKGNDPQNEWAEIYNPTEAEVDISGWQICDNSFCDTVPLSTPIPTKGFAVITPNASTWDYWAVPGTAIKIVLDSNIGGGLADSGDAVILKNTSGDKIDSMSYGDDSSELNPSIPDSGKGKSLARIIKGYDSDSAKDWIINATPNPGTNPSDGGVEIMRFTYEGVEVASSEKGLEPLPIGNEITQENQTEEEIKETPVEEKNIIEQTEGNIQIDNPVVETETFEEENAPIETANENTPITVVAENEDKTIEENVVVEDKEDTTEKETPVEAEPQETPAVEAPIEETPIPNENPAPELPANEEVILPEKQEIVIPDPTVPDSNTNNISPGNENASPDINNPPTDGGSIMEGT